jgi:hypothetical protein
LSHNGTTVATSDASPVVVGGLQAKLATAGGAAASGRLVLHGSLTSNSTLAPNSSQSGDGDLQGKLGSDSIDIKGGLAAPYPGTHPVATLQTPTSTTRIGTYTLAMDDGVLSGITGTGLTIKQNWGTLHSLQFGMLLGGDGTENPFQIYGLGYSLPINAGKLTLTAGYVDQSGPVQTGGGDDFLRNGFLYGLTYTHPVNTAGFSYRLRYGLIDYYDELNMVWRDDRAMDLQTGFRFLRLDWLFDYNRAGPYFPTLTSTNVAPDTETESLGAKRKIGRFEVGFEFAGSRSALNGSPSVQTGHVWSETLSLGYTLRNADALQFDLSNAVNHILSDQPTASLNDNIGLTYSGARGKTKFQFSVGSATTQDNSGNTNHTISESLQVSRPIINKLNLVATYNINDSLANTSSGTIVGDQLSLTTNYAIGMYSVSSGYSWSSNRPFDGIATPSTRGVNLGLGYKPKFSPTIFQASMTHSVSGTSSTIGRLSLSRQY